MVSGQFPPIRVTVRINFMVAGKREGGFPWGQLSQNLFEYIKNKWKNTLNVDISCTYRQTFECSRALNMPQIMNISRFQRCQG